jgi:hypothetical protein
MASHVSGVTTAQVKNSSKLHLFERARSRPCMPTFARDARMLTQAGGSPCMQADSFKLDDKPFV